MIIRWDSLVDYYVGIKEQFEILKSYYINKNNVMSIHKDENCYVKIRLIYDDGG